MTDGFVNNLVTALGGEQEGPDPTKLHGLQEFAEFWLEEKHVPAEELAGYFQSMRYRIQEAHRDRFNALEGRRSQLAPGLVELIERNLEGYLGVDAALAHFVEAFTAENFDECREALGALDEASEDLKDSTEQLYQLARSPQPLCPKCGSGGPESLCPACNADRLIPDPDTTNEEFIQAQVPQEVMEVFEAYTGVIEGRTLLADLANALQPLEFSLLEAQALAEQAVDENPDDESNKNVLELVNGALEGVNRMHGATENRQTRELNQGWLQIFRGAATLTSVIPTLDESDEDEDEGSEVPEPASEIEASTE